MKKITNKQLALAWLLYTHIQEELDKNIIKADKFRSYSLRKWHIETWNYLFPNSKKFFSVIYPSDYFEITEMKERLWDFFRNFVNQTSSEHFQKGCCVGLLMEPKKGE